MVTFRVMLGAMVLLGSRDMAAQCAGSWSPHGPSVYLCASGPFLIYDLGVICPPSPQVTYTFTSPVQSLELKYSAFGTLGTAGSSRMSVFLNGSKINLALACDIQTGCQNPAGDYSVDGGCLVDSVSGADGGISGYIHLAASAFGLSSITSIGVATTEPLATGTVVEVGMCDFIQGPTLNGWSDTVLCAGESLLLDATTPGATYLWQDSSSTPTFVITESGTYWVEVTVGCSRASDTITVTYSQPSVNLGPDTTLCQGQSLTLEASSVGASYLWEDGSTDPSVLVTEEGVYWVEVRTQCDTVGDTITVRFEPPPDVDVGQDTSLCEDQVLVLDATTAGATYLWQDSSTASTTVVANPGYFWVTVNRNGCMGTDTLLVTDGRCTCDLLIPNAFTPNGDATNDVFKPIPVCPVRSYSFLIFNRWGQIVFQTNNPDDGWDGRHDGVPAPMGVFAYLVKYSFSESAAEQAKAGSVTLLR